jgi:FMN phosphatase YigB (HAD superfamily)
MPASSPRPSAPAALIFDLDNCLAPAKTVGEDLFEPAFQAVRAVNHGKLSEAELSAAFAACWIHPLDWVAQRHGFSPEMLAAAWEVFRNMEAPPLLGGYDDLHLLKTLPLPRYLVTSGFRRLQEGKIRALGLAPHFAAIHVDAIDDPVPRGKEALFRHIRESGGFAADQVVVIGDNPDSEIKAGIALGMITVQILRPGVQSGENAWHYVEGLEELAALLKELFPGL